MTRDWTVVLARMVLSIVFALFVGCVFLRTGKTDSSDYFNLHSHFGALAACAFTILIMASQSALIEFPAERPIFLREFTTDHYGVAAYFLSKLAVEFILSGLVSLCMVRT